MFTPKLTITIIICVSLIISFQVAQSYPPGRAWLLSSWPPQRYGCTVEAMKVRLFFHHTEDTINLTFKVHGIKQLVTRGGGQIDNMAFNGFYLLPSFILLFLMPPPWDGLPESTICMQFFSLKLLLLREPKISLYLHVSLSLSVDLSGYLSIYSPFLGIL